MRERVSGGRPARSPPPSRLRAGLAALAVGLAGGVLACGGGEEVAVAAGDLRLSRIVAPEPVTGERTALYLRIRSAGDADTLTGVDAGGLGRASLHESRQTRTGMRMEPVDAVPVPAEGTLELRPGGYHVMIESLSVGLEAGDTFEVTLGFSGAGAVPVPVEVVPYAALDSIFSIGGRPPPRSP